MLVPRIVRDQHDVLRRLRRLVLAIYSLIASITTSIWIFTVVRIIRERVVIWRVKWQCEVRIFVCELANFGASSRGRRNYDELRFQALYQSWPPEFNHVTIVIEWFPNSHNNDVTNAVSQETLRPQGSLHDLRWFPQQRLFCDNSAGTESTILHPTWVVTQIDKPYSWGINTVLRGVC